jgi:hypothetical protein
MFPNSSTNYHLAIILESEPFICPPCGHDYRYDTEYVSPKAGLDSPLYRPPMKTDEQCNGWGVDETTGRTLEDMWFLSHSLYLYMNGGNVEGITECKDWFLLAISIQTKVLRLPKIPTIDKDTSIDAIIHECVRVTAVIFCKAILTHTPFSRAYSQQDLDIICRGMALVPCTRWKEICGIWLWMLCVFNPAARYKSEGLPLRMLLKNCTSYLGLVDWQILINTMESFLCVQQWIRQLGSRYPLVKIADVS